MIVVGVDPHKKSHTAVAVAASTGEVIDQITVRATDAGHQRLVRFCRALGDDELTVALEDVRHVSGRLERILLQQGQRVVRVPPALMGEARRGSRERGKSDPIDATAVARAALAHPDLPQAHVDEASLEIHLWASHREDLVAERTRCQARLRWHLHALEPEFDPPAGALDRICWLDRCTRILAPRGGARAEIARELTAECARLSRRIAALEREIAEQVEIHAPQLREIPGCGPLTAAKLVGEIAGIGRFGSAAQLARYAGVAPVPVASGGYARHRLDRSGNRQLNLALHRLALTQARVHPPARRYLERKRAEGKSPREARRCLKRHLANVVFRALRAPAGASSSSPRPAAAALLT